MSDSLQPHGLYPARLFCPWNSPGKNTGVGCHSLLQGIFPTLGLNLGFLLCRQILYCLNHQGSPKMQSVSCSVRSWNCLGNNTEMSSYSLLQKTFPTQGSNLGLLHGRHILTVWAPREGLGESLQWSDWVSKSKQNNNHVSKLAPWGQSGHFGW